jgi:hypothetical protein
VRQQINCELIALPQYENADAYDLIGAIFADVIAVIRPRLPTLSLDELELLLADTRRRAERRLADMIAGDVNASDALDAVDRAFVTMTAPPPTPRKRTRRART